MAVLVTKLALFGFSVSLFNDAALLNVRRAIFTEASAALKQLAGLSQGLPGGVPADAFHGWVPGGDASLCIHGENTVGHRIDDSVDKTNIPDFMRFLVHDRIRLSFAVS
jgi:hypothetical protein